MWRMFMGLAAFVAVGLFLLHRYRGESQRRQREPARFYARALAVLERGELQATGAVGYPRLAGRYQGFPVQVQPVIDTLATRRLPALWLLVTLQDALPVAARLDLMMRPTAATTFSNFDLLPVTLQLPAGFPEHSVLRTDDAQSALPAGVLAPHLDVFESPRAKELLITPNGVRLVWLIAEADRARYGVFREADFGETDLDPDLLRSLLDRLVALRHSVVESMRKVS
ncbi:MAG: hypothetical protein ABI885_03635 [Gammaproteobacteria bacterium]